MKSSQYSEVYPLLDYYFLGLSSLFYLVGQYRQNARILQRNLGLTPNSALPYFELFFQDYQGRLHCNYFVLFIFVKSSNNENILTTKK